MRLSRFLGTRRRFELKNESIAAIFVADVCLTMLWIRCVKDLVENDEKTAANDHRSSWWCFAKKTVWHHSLLSINV
jgi:hypothetical protein